MLVASTVIAGGRLVANTDDQSQKTKLDKLIDYPISCAEHTEKSTSFLACLAQVSKYSHGGAAASE